LKMLQTNLLGYLEQGTQQLLTDLASLVSLDPTALGAAGVDLTMKGGLNVQSLESNFGDAQTPKKKHRFTPAVDQKLEVRQK